MASSPLSDGAHISRSKSARRRRRSLAVGLGAAALVLIGIVVPAPGGAATAPTSIYVGVASSTPAESLGVVTMDSLNQMAADGTVTLSTQINPLASTPNGYKLIHPGYRRSDYVYDSDWVYQYLFLCSSTCIEKSETRVQLHQYVVGGSSHKWVLTTNAQTVNNPGGLSWQYHFLYYCGVNVSGASDHTCDNGANASGVEVAYNPGEQFTKSWGATNSITVFPMAALSTHWNTGTVVTTKFRGYDTLSRSRTTRLNGTSGTGG